MLDLLLQNDSDVLDFVSKDDMQGLLKKFFLTFSIIDLPCCVSFRCEAKNFCMIYLPRLQVRKHCTIDAI